MSYWRQIPAPGWAPPEPQSRCTAVYQMSPVYLGRQATLNSSPWDNPEEKDGDEGLEEMDEGWLSVWNFPNPLEQIVTQLCWEVLWGFIVNLDQTVEWGLGHKRRDKVRQKRDGRSKSLVDSIKGARRHETEGDQNDDKVKTIRWQNISFNPSLENISLVYAILLSW